MNPQVMIDNVWKDCRVISQHKNRYLIAIGNRTQLVPPGAFRNFYAKPCKGNCGVCRNPCESQTKGKEK